MANHRKESWGSEGPALAAVTGLDMVVFKFGSPSLAAGPPIYAAVHYLRAR